MQGVAGVPKPVLGLVCQHLTTRPYGTSVKEVVGYRNTFLPAASAPFYVSPLTKVGDLLIACATWFSGSSPNAFNSSWTRFLDLNVYEDTQYAIYAWKIAELSDLVSVPTGMAGACSISVVTVRNSPGIATFRYNNWLKPTPGANASIEKSSAGKGLSIAFLVDRETVPYVETSYPLNRDRFKLWGYSADPGEAYPQAAFEILSTAEADFVDYWAVPDITTRSFGLSWVQILLK